jgi:hypothetical protein
MKLDPRLQFLKDPIVIITIAILILITAISNPELVIQYLKK